MSPTAERGRLGLPALLPSMGPDGRTRSFPTLPRLESLVDMIPRPAEEAAEVVPVLEEALVTD